MIGAQKKRVIIDKYDAVYMNQFETEHNPEAYTHTLGKEITEALPHIDYFVAVWIWRNVYRCS